jgi:ferredoxin
MPIMVMGLAVRQHVRQHYTGRVRRWGSFGAGAVAGLAAGSALAFPGGAFAASGGTDSNNHVAMLYDATICVGCNACTNACRQWNKTMPELDARGTYDAPTELSADTYTLIQLYKGEDEFSFVKRQCMHCLDPACASACPAKALEKTSRARLSTTGNGAWAAATA